MRELATIDYAVVAIYLLIVIGVSLRVTRRAPNAEERFLAGRSQRSCPRRLGAQLLVDPADAGHHSAAKAQSRGWFAATQAGWLNLHFTLVAGVLLAVTVVAIHVFQFLLAQVPSPSQLDSVDRSRMPVVPAGIRRAGILIIVVTLALVFYFR